MKDKKHMRHLIAYGVYYGFSDESILEFVKEFDYCGDEEITDVDSRRQRSMHGLVVSKAEFETLTMQQIVSGINLRRFCSTPWPAEVAVKDAAMEIMRLTIERQDYRSRVNRLMDNAVGMYG